ncbi:MAG: hypothetical protein QM734_09440 [Cyclobacteriaceae bacterium]
MAFSPFFVLTLAIFACWGNSYTFFWRDEWNFLSEFREIHFGFFFQPFNGHIKPIFKLFYFLESQLFGINTVFYNITNLLIYSVAIYFTYVLATESSPEKEDGKSKIMAFGLAFVVALHPINFNHLLWSFQVSQSLYILFQVLCVLYFVKYVQSDSKKYLILSILFLLMQNYSFGNGLFMPFVFLGYAILFKKRDKIKLVAIYFFIFMATIMIQALCGNPDGLILKAIHNWYAILVEFINFLDINVCRIFTIIDGLHRFHFLGIALFAAFVFYGYSRKSVNKEVLTIYLLWFIINCVSIPIVRQDSAKVPHYYTVMSLIPVCFIVYLIAYDSLSSFAAQRKSISFGILSTICVAFYIIDARMVSIFSRRNALNEQCLKSSIEKKIKYYAYDDPYFSEETDAFRVDDVQEIYLYWKGRTKFLLTPSEKK